MLPVIAAIKGIIMCMTVTAAALIVFYALYTQYQRRPVPQVRHRRYHSSRRESIQITRRRSVHQEVSFSDPIESEMECIICREERIQVELIPCHHACLCRKCVTSLVKLDTRCPLCRVGITSFSNYCE